MQWCPEPLEMISAHRNCVYLILNAGNYFLRISREVGVPVTKKVIIIK